jgi:hypothetical protein
MDKEFGYILKEGGNVFKTLDGDPITQRIATIDVDPTVEFLERITGYDWSSELDPEDNRPIHYLGTTGRKNDPDGTFEKNSSGDLDLNTDLNKVSKEDLIAKLVRWCQDNGIAEEDIMIKNAKKKDGWIRDAGDQVHFRTPIRGDVNNGFVQADFMFTTNPEFQIGAKRGGTAQYRGEERAIFLASIARGRGFSFSPKFGLRDSGKKEVIADNWDEIAKILLHPNATAADTRTIERMLKIIINDPDYESLVAPARKNGIDLPERTIPESGRFMSTFLKVLSESISSYTKPPAILEEGARIQHAEDIVFWEGSAGATRVIEAFKNLENGKHKDVTVKWDGSPAIIFGRNEKGEFVFTDKSGFLKKDGVGRTTSPESLKNELLGRSGGKFREDPGRIDFANKMAKIFSIYEKATPKNFRGYFKGDLLYYSTPELVNDQYVFKPNLVTYKVHKDSPTGQRIATSETGVVVHRVVDKEGNEGPLKDTNIFIGNDVFIVPPITVQNPPKVDASSVRKLQNIVGTRGPAIDTFLDATNLQEQKLSDLPQVLYTYTNSKVDTGLNNLGQDFIQWMGSSRLSGAKQQRIAEYIKQNQEGFNGIWEVVTATMQLKDNIIGQMDRDKLDVEQSIGDEAGGEGYVLAHPEGDIKFVPREFFSRANRAVQR